MDPSRIFCTYRSRKFSMTCKTTTGTMKTKTMTRRMMTGRMMMTGSMINWSRSWSGKMNGNTLNRMLRTRSTRSTITRGFKIQRVVACAELSRPQQRRMMKTNRLLRIVLPLILRMHKSRTCSSSPIWTSSDRTASST